MISQVVEVENIEVVVTVVVVVNVGVVVGRNEQSGELAR